MSSSEPPLSNRFSRAQWLLLMVLAAVQFTHIVDFVVIIPLATTLERDLGITTQDFGFMVSAFGFAAGLAGILFAPLLDRFDRKPTLLALYAGFTLGTLLCAAAPSFAWLVVGRILAGAFGGTTASVVLAIVGDSFPPARRGTAMGVVMSAFSVASIVGIPAGLWLADSAGLGWRAPFYVIAAGGAGLFAVAAYVLPPVRGHLNSTEPRVPFLDVLCKPAHVRAYVFMTAVVFSSFAVIPYIAAFMEKNVGRSREDLPWVYVWGGLATLVTMNAFGRLADRVPRLTLYRVLQLTAIVPVLLLPQLPYGTSLVVCLLVTTAFMVFISGRIVPAMAMVTSVCTPRQRGTFMSITSSMQQFGSGIAAVITAQMLGKSGEGEPIVGYDNVALLSAGVAILCLFLAGLIRPAPTEAVAAPVVVPEVEAVA